MSRSTSPHQSSSTELQAPSDQSAPELPSLGQLCSLLQSLAFSHTHSPSLFDADNLCLYCETPLTHTSPSTGALLLLPSTIELPCGHRLCRTCYSGASSRRRTCPIPLCNRALPLESIAAVSSPSAQFPLSNPMIKSKSEPSLFPPPASSLQAQGRGGGGATGGHAFHRVPSLGQLPNVEGESDSAELAADSVALTLPLHLLDVASVKAVVNAADVFDVANDCMPAQAQAAVDSQFSAVSLTAADVRSEDFTHDAAVVVSSDCDPAAASHPSPPLPPYIKPSAPLLPARVRALKGDVPPIPPPCLRLPWHLKLPPVVHTFTLKTEHPGKPGAHHSSRALSIN